jgi:hypothetical protein
MKLRSFGSGTDVSVLGIGCSRVGSISNPIHMSEIEAMLEAAVQAGASGWPRPFASGRLHFPLCGAEKEAGPRPRRARRRSVDPLQLVLRHSYVHADDSRGASLTSLPAKSKPVGSR